MKSTPTRVSDCAMAVRALWGVSTSAPMPRYPKYVAAMTVVEQHDSVKNPSGSKLWHGLLQETVTNAAPSEGGVPWSASEMTTPRVLAAITSFTDDYGGAYPAELFPRDRVLSLFELLKREWATRKAPLGIVEQYRLGLQVAEGSPFGAAVVLHAVSRAIARGRDTRALPELTMSLDERISVCGLFAAFSAVDSRGGDAAGDTYHYWAMLVGGAWCAWPSRRGVVVRGASALLYQGADLMWLIRDRVFGSPLFFGRHKWIDRLGLAHGEGLARACALAVPSASA